MSLRLSLLVTVTLMVVGAASEGEAGKKLEAMRNHFLRWKDTHRGHPVNYASSSAYSSAGSANAASSAGTGSGGHHYAAPYSYASPQESGMHATGYNPALRRNAYGQGASAASMASAGHAASSASGYASAGEPSFESYGHEVAQQGGFEHGYPQHGYPPHGYPPHGYPHHGHEQHGYGQHSHGHHGHGQHGHTRHHRHGGHGGHSGHARDHASYASPEVAHHSNFAPPRYVPVASVHPQVPQVAGNFYGGRAASEAGVSTSVAAAGSVAAAAAAAAASGSQGVSGVSFGSQGPAGATSAAVASTGSLESAHAAQSYRPVNQNDHVVETESSSEHYSKPESLDQFAAATGTQASDGRGVVTSSYVRSTENEEEHEDGKEDSDHHYKANSYGKTYDENHNEKFDRDDEDIIHTPNLFRKTKRVVNFHKDLNKARRESGSSVLAQDRHSASYNKDKKKFKEDVNQNFHAEGQGVLETGSSNERSSADEESEERFDSRNLGDGFVGVDGVKHDKRPMFNPAAAAAASASSAGVSSAATAGAH